VTGALHFTTFDGLQFSCQGQGDYILLRNSASGFQMQGQFRKKSDLLTFLTGIAVQADPSAPTIEILLSDDNNSDPTSCLVNGESCRTASRRYEDDFYVISFSDQTYEVAVKATNVSVAVVFVDSGIPHFEVQVFLPRGYSRVGLGYELRGLLGSPNDQPYDDWQKGHFLSESDELGCTAEWCIGHDIPSQSDKRHHRHGYEYCTATWCVRDVSSSLFSYNAESSFGFFSRCDDPYPGVVDVSNASSELKQLCGNDITCLTDGVTMGILAAQHLLEAESRIGRASFVRFHLSTIQVSNTLLMEATIDLSDHLSGGLPEYFDVRLNSESSAMPGPGRSFRLYDDGSGLGRDTKRGDGIYSNVMPVRYEVPGERVALSASPFCSVYGADGQFQNFNAIGSYSKASGIGQHANTDREIAAGTLRYDRIRFFDLDELTLHIQYVQYGSVFSDLSYATIFLNETVGWCDELVLKRESDYVTASGVVLLTRSHARGAWSGSTTIVLTAGWRQFSGWYPAMAILRLGTTKNGQFREAVVVEFEPGLASENTCATKVGQVDVAVTEAGGVEIVVRRSARTLPSTPSPSGPIVSPTASTFPSSQSPTTIFPSTPSPTAPIVSPTASTFPPSPSPTTKFPSTPPVTAPTTSPTTSFFPTPR
jgi:von Willebrand factor type D domain